MKIRDKINMDIEGLEENGPITIVAFGDSVTHGSFLNELDYENAYWNQLRKKILKVRDYVPVNVINAGIGGVTANRSLKRLEGQVLPHNPDLIIVCFGLNDVNEGLTQYLDSLGIIFEKCAKVCDEVIFMTPNMLNTYVADDTPEEYLGYAKITSEMQNSGKMDLYINSAVKLAREMNIKVCDCYSEWKKLSETKDTTQLLANRINHPTKEMHGLFAEKLFETIFDEGVCEASKADDTMFKM